MTADDLQENRRVCKFPCTSRGEGPALGRQLRGAGASGGSAPRLQPVQGAGSRPQAPAAQQRGGAPQGRPARAKPGRPAAVPASCTYFPKRSSPGFSRPRPRQAAAWGQGQAAGRRPVYSLYKAQEAGRRPPLRSSGQGAPAGRPARAKPGRPAAAFSPCTGPPKGEKPYPLAPSSSGCSCSPRRAASSAAPVSESSAQRLVGFFRGSSCPKGTK